MSLNLPETSIKFWARKCQQITIQRAYQKFSSSNTSLEDEPLSSLPPAINNDKLKVLIETDSPKTTREVAEEVNFNHSTVVRHLNQIGKPKKLDMNAARIER